MQKNIWWRYKKHTILADSVLREDIYCVLTSHDMPLSVGRSFRLIPSGFTGVTTSSSRNSSSSSLESEGHSAGGLHN
jgi:uncharacterized protein YbdZ (MbtH family)